MPQCFAAMRKLAHREGRSVIPPVVSLAGPFATVHYWAALACVGTLSFDQRFLYGHGPA
jgi:hypothetical protein